MRIYIKYNRKRQALAQSITVVNTDFQSYCNSSPSMKSIYPVCRIEVEASCMSVAGVCGLLEICTLGSPS